MTEVEASTDRCACGALFCGNREQGHFFRITPKKSIRADVFRWPDHGFWTWCPVVDGEHEDVGQVMGHYWTQRAAFADALAWTSGMQGAPR